MQGPTIHVAFEVSNEKIREINLTLHSHFAWEIHGSSKHLTKQIETWLKEYSQGRQPSIELPLILDFIPAFTRKVLEELYKVPFGQTLSYQDIARLVGNPKGPRAVGQACGRNPFPLVIPCHRILAVNKRLGGFSCGLPIKEALLSFESVEVR
jgi:methylated-DNA-[protein]-cysteine S-methyltransferase